MRSGHLLLLAVGLAYLVLRGDAAYLQDAEEKRYDCKDEGFISTLFGDGMTTQKERCVEYCKRIRDDIEAMEVADLKQKDADKRYCLDTANALAKLPEAIFGGGPLEDVEELVKKIHKGACIATLMADWAARDAACSSEQNESAQQLKVLQRVATILAQFYGKPAPQERRASTGEMPEAKTFCAYQVAEWFRNGAILFDKDKCKNMHPMYNDMKGCTPDCWNFMKDKMKGTGCLALYYDIMFQTIGSTRKVDEEGKPTVEMLTAPDSGTVPDAAEKTTCKSTPCTSMMDTVKACASAGKEKDWIKYSSKAFSQDWRGTVPGGVYCWQGMDCH